MALAADAEDTADFLATPDSLPSDNDGEGGAEDGPAALGARSSSSSSSSSAAEVAVAVAGSEEDGDEDDDDYAGCGSDGSADYGAGLDSPSAAAAAASAAAAAAFYSGEGPASAKRRAREAARQERAGQRRSAAADKERERQRRAEERLAERRRKAAEKETEASERRRDRERGRASREKEKEAEASQKASERAASRQAHGKHAGEEIELVAPPRFWGTAAGAATAHAMAEAGDDGQGYEFAHAADDGAGGGAAGAADGAAAAAAADAHADGAHAAAAAAAGGAAHLALSPRFVPGHGGRGRGGGGGGGVEGPFALRWLRRRGVHGAVARDAVRASDTGWLALWWAGATFMQLVARGCGALGDAARSCRRHAAGAAPTRVVFVVEGASAAIAAAATANYKRRQRGEPESAMAGCTDAQLEEARVWLYVHHDVEVMTQGGAEESAAYLVGLTRALAELPYMRERTVLSCVVKVKARSAAHAACADAEGAKLGDTWMHQLMQVPGVSETRAQALVRAYPSMQALVSQYASPALSTAQKEALLENELGRNKQLAISQRIYKLYTSGDPDMKLDRGRARDGSVYKPKN